MRDAVHSYTADYYIATACTYLWLQGILSSQRTVYRVRLACSNEADAGEVTQRRMPSTTRHTIILIYMICVLTADFHSQEQFLETFLCGALLDLANRMRRQALT